MLPNLVGIITASNCARIYLKQCIRWWFVRSGDNIALFCRLISFIMKLQGLNLVSKRLPIWQLCLISSNYFVHRSHWVTPHGSNRLFYPQTIRITLLSGWDAVCLKSSYERLRGRRAVKHWINHIKTNHVACDSIACQNLPELQATQSNILEKCCGNVHEQPVHYLSTDRRSCVIFSSCSIVLSKHLLHFLL